MVPGTAKGCYGGRRHPARFPVPPGSPLVIGQLLLHQEQVGLELVPLLQDLLQLFLGEAAVSGAPARGPGLGLLVRQWLSFLGDGEGEQGDADPKALLSPPTATRNNPSSAARSPPRGQQLTGLGFGCGASEAALLLLFISLWVCTTTASRSDFFSSALLSCACTTATL